MNQGARTRLQLAVNRLSLQRQIVRSTGAANAASVIVRSGPARNTNRPANSVRTNSV
jgi:hypothetical protein